MKIGQPSDTQHNVSQCSGRQWDIRAKGVGWEAWREGKRDEMDERRSPEGEMEGREYRLNGRSVLNHFTLSLSLLGCSLIAHISSLFLSWTCHNSILSIMHLDTFPLYFIEKQVAVFGVFCFIRDLLITCWWSHKTFKGCFPSSISSFLLFLSTYILSSPFPGTPLLSFVPCPSFLLYFLLIFHLSSSLPLLSSSSFITFYRKLKEGKRVSSKPTSFLLVIPVTCHLCCCHFKPHPLLYLCFVLSSVCLRFPPHLPILSSNCLLNSSVCATPRHACHSHSVFAHGSAGFFLAPCHSLSLAAVAHHSCTLWLSLTID